MGLLLAHSMHVVCDHADGADGPDNCVLCQLASAQSAVVLTPAVLWLLMAVSGRPGQRGRPGFARCSAKPISARAPPTSTS